jgi:hypothetical protein
VASVMGLVGGLALTPSVSSEATKEGRNLVAVGDSLGNF